MPLPFQLAVISDEVSQDLHELVAFAREFELGGVEIRSLFGKAFKDLTPADVREIGTHLRGEGLNVVGCASPVFKCSIDDPKDIAAHVEIFKRSVEAALEWGCNMVRVFTFLRKSTPSTDSDLEKAATHFSPLLEAINGTAIRIGVENEFSTMVGTGSEWRSFSRWLPSPSIGLVWDPCNIIFIPGSNDPVRIDYHQIAGRIIHFHVKDARRENGKPPQHCVELGTGDVDFPLQLQLLKSQGYQGWVSLETHWRQQALNAEVQHLPAGHAFSDGGRDASRICMKKLVDWMRRV